MSVKIQLQMIKLPLPKEIIDIIKSNVFYEKDIGEQRLRKKKTTNKILSADISRFKEEEKNPNEQSEHWGFGYFDTNEEGEKIQLQGTNCMYCGDYILHNHTSPQNIRCYCHVE